MGKNQDEGSSVGTRFYRTMIAGLSVVVANPKGEVAPETVRFVPFEERVEGSAAKVGYLATDNAVAQQKLAQDDNVEEIDEDSYINATDVEVNPKVKQAVL